MSLGIAAGPASAQTQEGLVNLDVSGNTVQVPVGIAANVCDVNVAVLVNDFLDQAAKCDAGADSQAIAVSSADPGATGDQSGLVNVRINNNTVQIPLAVALNVCDVNVAVLTNLFSDQAAQCDSKANSRARQFGPGA
jgi:hypothetical protein